MYIHVLGCFTQIDTGTQAEARRQAEATARAVQASTLLLLQRMIVLPCMVLVQATPQTLTPRQSTPTFFSAEICQNCWCKV